MAFAGKFCIDSSAGGAGWHPGKQLRAEQAQEVQLSGPQGDGCMHHRGMASRSSASSCKPRPTSGTCCAQQVRPCALTHIGAPCSDSDGARLSPKGSSGAMLHTTTTVSTRQRTSALHPPVFSVTFNAFFHLRRHCARRERAHMAMGPICAYGRSAIARLLRAPACCPWSPARTQ